MAATGANAERDGRFADEGWRVRKDGSTFWASVILTTLRGKDGRVTGFAKVTQDLTQRRETEERFQTLNKELRQRVQELDESRRVIELRTFELQKLSAELLRVQDEERGFRCLRPVWGWGRFSSPSWFRG